VNEGVRRKPAELLARREGVEPPTPRFEAWCSIQLSYRRSEALIPEGTGPRQRVAAVPQPVAIW
jgi:hypothetical protein